MYNQSVKYYETTRNTVNLGLFKEENITLFEREKKKRESEETNEMGQQIERGIH